MINIPSGSIALVKRANVRSLHNHQTLTIGDLVIVGDFQYMNSVGERVITIHSRVGHTLIIERYITVLDNPI